MARSSVPSADCEHEQRAFQRRTVVVIATRTQNSTEASEPSLLTSRCAGLVEAKTIALFGLTTRGLREQCVEAFSVAVTVNDIP